MHGVNHQSPSGEPLEAQAHRFRSKNRYPKRHSVVTAGSLLLASLFPHSEAQLQPQHPTNEEAIAEYIAHLKSFSREMSTSNEQNIQRAKEVSMDELVEMGSNNKHEFIDVMWTSAKEAEDRYGAPAVLIVAQAIHESGWGQATPTNFNFFGRTGKGPAGSATSDGIEFARYHSLHEALLDIGGIYANSGHYGSATEAYKDHQDWSRFLNSVASTYAEDPAYIEKIHEAVGAAAKRHEEYAQAAGLN